MPLLRESPDDFTPGAGGEPIVVPVGVRGA